MPDLDALGREPLANVGLRPPVRLALGLRCQILGRLHRAAHQIRAHGRPVALQVLAGQPDHRQDDEEGHGDHQDEAGTAGALLVAVVAVLPGPPGRHGADDEERDLHADGLGLVVAVLVGHGHVVLVPAPRGAALPVGLCDETVPVGHELLHAEDGGADGSQSGDHSLAWLEEGLKA